MKKKTGSADQWIQFIGKDKLQTFQDNFARAYGVSMIFLDMDGNPLTVGSQNSLFCFTIQKEHAVRCQENFQMDMDTMQKGESFIHVCPFGIACLYVPVYFNNRLTAFAGIGGLTYENSTIPENLKQRFHITSYNKETTWNILMLERCGAETGGRASGQRTGRTHQPTGTGNRAAAVQGLYQ